MLGNGWAVTFGVVFLLVNIGSCSSAEKILRRVKRKMIRAPWQGGIIPYLFDKNPKYREGEAAISQIKAAMRFYEDRTCVKFMEWTPDLQSKLRLGHKSRMVFGKYGGCFSSIGNVVSPNVKEVRQIATCEGEASFHEIGHVLGLKHEHQRSDRVDVLRMFPENAKDPNAMNLKIDRPHWFDRNVPFDLSSVMMYKLRVGSKNEKPVFWPYDSEDLALVRLQPDYGATFYDVKSINLGYRCAEWKCYWDKHLDCQNDGYKAFIGGNCQCVCPPGLGGKHCEKIYMPTEPAPNTWPDGDYSIMTAYGNCPEGFRPLHSAYMGMYLTYAFSIDARKYQLCQSQSSLAPSNMSWPKGQYCLLKTLRCPQGFSEGAFHMTSTQSINVHFCCRSDGNPGTSLKLPRTPFTLFPLYSAKEPHRKYCQSVEGMRQSLEKIRFVWPEEAFLRSPHPFVMEEDGFLSAYTCRYDPIDYNCGGVYDVTIGSDIEFSTIGSMQVATECTWLFKGPLYSLIQIELIEFDLMQRDEDNRCRDFLEVRKHHLGQHGRRYCGTSLSGMTVTSKHNHLVLNLQTNVPVRTSKIKGRIKVIRGGDLCYDVKDKGATYQGRMNYTQKYEPCLPWDEVKHCFDKKTEKSSYHLLGHDYCRNPNGLVKPWCFTSTDCYQDMCDVCLLEKCHDKSDECLSRIVENADYCEKQDAFIDCHMTCNFCGTSSPFASFYDYARTL